MKISGGHWYNGAPIKIFNENNELVQYCLEYDTETREAQVAIITSQINGHNVLATEDGALKTKIVPNCWAADYLGNRISSF